MAIELSLYTRKKRRKKRSLKLELQCLRIEVSQLQHRHNELVKAILALSQGATANTSVHRVSKDISSSAELDFINACLGNSVDDDIGSLSIEEEVEDLLRG